VRTTGTRMFILRSPPVVRQKDADWIARWIASVNRSRRGGVVYDGRRPGACSFFTE
jgi:hypothetical protein